MPYTPILGTLGYVLSPDRARVLMIHRNSRTNDQHLGKYNGLGGKLERDEDAASGMIREIREEAGIDVTAMTLRGTVNWPGFGPHGEDWLGFIFAITSFTGMSLVRNDEGELAWIEVERLIRACSLDPVIRANAHLPMWPGDPHFIPLVLDADPRPFHGVMPYENGAPTSWQCWR